MNDAGCVQPRLHIEHGLLGWFQNGVQAADDHHGEDRVPVLAPHVDIPQDVIGDTPDEADDPIQTAVSQGSSSCRAAAPQAAEVMGLRRARPAYSPR